MSEEVVLRKLHAWMSGGTVKNNDTESFVSLFGQFCSLSDLQIRCNEGSENPVLCFDVLP